MEYDDFKRKIIQRTSLEFVRVSLVIVVVGGQQGTRILLLSSVLLDDEEVAALGQALLPFFGDVDGLALGEGALEAEGFGRQLLALLGLALHFVLEAESEELVDHFLEDFAVLQLPDPGIEAVAELLPNVLLFVICGPLIKHDLDFLLRQNWHLTNNTLILHKTIHNLNKLLLGHARLHFGIILLKRILNLILLPLDQPVLGILPEIVLIELLHRGRGHPRVLLLLKEEPGLLELRLPLLIPLPHNQAVVLVQVLLAHGEAVSLGSSFESLLFVDGDRPRPLRQVVLLLTDSLRLDALRNSYNMAVEGLDLRHQVDYLESVVGLLGEWIAEEVELVEEGEFCELEKEAVEVAELVVAEEEGVKELEVLETVDVLNHVVLADDFLATEVALDVIEALQLVVAEPDLLEVGKLLKVLQAGQVSAR